MEKDVDNEDDNDNEDDCSKVRARLNAIRSRGQRKQAGSLGFVSKLKAAQPPFYPKI
jgi:hypothetical protein